MLCAALLAPGGSLRAQAQSWEETLDRIVPAVVALRVTATRSFDAQRATVTVATGFVVDAERGLVLTNRHVVMPGPVVAEAIFLNHERVPIFPVYRDPVHDFGFFRFDPEQVRFMEPGEIPLAPEAARVGTEVRVVGNDAGEKLSILAGTLARLDRAAPAYGSDRYNDFNTFYFQAASSTSGGSSGSPVIDRRGRALALNAGAARRSSSSFFLPLERVARALEAIREGRPVTRGSLETVFEHQPFDELERLGLRPETEARVRSEDGGRTGLLVVKEVVPGGPGDGRLEPGDVVTSLEGRLLDSFVALEEVLDERVGAGVALDVERGGEPLRVEVAVRDLHAITPGAYLEFGGGILHALSYQQARNRGIPVRGVMVATPGYALGRAGVPASSVLVEIGGAPVPDLGAAEALLAGRPDGDRVPVRFFRLSEPRAPRVAVLTVDRRWFPMGRCDRNDAAGTWDCRRSADPPAPAAPVPAVVDLAAEGPRAARRLAASLAFVEFDVPYRIDGVHGTAFSGSGLVVDAERGLVVVDRDTVPISLGDVTLTFGRSLQVPGKVVALHPVHNLAIVAYDPDALGETPIESASLDPAPLAAGDELWLVGLSPRQRVVARRTEVARVEASRLPLPATPRFREHDLELVSLTETTSTLGGALSDDKGRVRALWVSVSRDDRGKPRAFFAGIPAAVVAEWVEPLRSGAAFAPRTLGVELREVPLSEARDRGLSEAWARRMVDHDTGHRLLRVDRILAGAPAAALLEVGDLLLTIEDAPVTGYREVERASRAERLRLEVLRDAEVLSLVVPTAPLDPVGTRRALIWGGALLQDVPLPARMQRGVPPVGVYVAARAWGSPADRHALRNTRRIVAVDGVPTGDLESFVAAVRDVPDRGSVRLHIVDLDGKREVLTLETDLRYWPTQELVWSADGWRRRAVTVGETHGGGRGNSIN